MSTVGYYSNRKKFQVGLMFDVYDVTATIGGLDFSKRSASTRVPLTKSMQKIVRYTQNSETQLYFNERLTYKIHGKAKR